MHEQLEEINVRLDQCINNIYAARPKAVDNNIDRLLLELDKHQGDFTLFYIHATIKHEGHRGLKTLASLFGVNHDSDESWHIEISLALSIVCANCNETHHYTLVPFTCEFLDEVKAYNLVGELHNILNG